MFSLFRPSARRIEQFLADQQRQPLSYAGVGRSRTAESPPGMLVNHARVRLGHGAETYRQARVALASWCMFSGTWIGVSPPTMPIAQGNVIAIVARCFGLWTANACRIVYVIEEAEEALKRFGFGYGTVDGHAMSGEERFLVTWDRRDNSVWYDVWSFSRPRHWAARLLTAWVRRMQRRFVKESTTTMLAAVSSMQTK